MNIILIIWLFAIILSSIVTTFLDAIDVVDGSAIGFIVLCIIMIPFIIPGFILYYAIIWFHELCFKHKDKIRKFLRIKK